MHPHELRGHADNEEMPEPLLPLFPLDLVLLPGMRLPLHIFEDRYKEMIGDAIAQRTEFGIVQGSDEGILNIGCTATVEEVVQRYPDGRLDILTVGRRRFEIVLLDQEKEYLRASVTFFDDEPEEPAPDQLRTLAVAAFRVLRKDEQVPEGDDPELSFKLAAAIPDKNFRQMMLSIRSESERLRHIVEQLPVVAARMRRIARAQQLAPRNGHL